MMGRMQSVMVVAALAVSLVVATGRSVAAEERFATDFGMGVGAVGTNVVYIPAKLVYATLGGLTGGLAYGLTGLNYDVARNIWVPSLGGTYVVTPSMLRGEEVIYFSGVTQPRSRAVVRAERGSGSRSPRGY